MQGTKGIVERDRQGVKMEKKEEEKKIQELGITSSSYKLTVNG